MIPSLNDFVEALNAAELPLNPSQVQKAALFAHILHRENEAQNLTRILGVKEFIEGHLQDVIELLKLPTLGTKVMDIGCGSGVPGLLAACIDLKEDREWQLVESEVGKANYLRDSILELELTNALMIHARADEVISKLKPDTVIARAVGSVEKISAWIWNCSTWNNLILFKSRAWNEEWKEALNTRFGKKLTVNHTHDYSNSDRTRYLVSLSRI